MNDDSSLPAGTRPAPIFAHLHLHTEYSLLDGGNRLDRLMQWCKHHGMTSVACTDHGNLFGAVAFYLAAKERGLKPILGIEAYVAPGSRHDRTYTGSGDGGYHLVLLAQSLEGWRNLLALSSESFLHGFYFKPRMDREILAAHHAGLIAINGHLGSEIGEHLLEFERTGDALHWQKAVESATWHARCFPGRFYIELQHHVPEQNAINKHLIRLARELALPLVCDNDAHYLRAEDHDAHDTLVCISTGKGKLEPERMKYSTELYVKTPQQMRDLFAPYGEAGAEALRNAGLIAESCNVELPIGKSHAPMVRVVRRGRDGSGGDDGAAAWLHLPAWDDPRFAGDLTAWYKAYCAQFEVVPLREADDAPESQRAALFAAAKSECDAALRRLAEAGAVWRYGPDVLAAGPADPAHAAHWKAVRERLERELKILCDKGISAYFLIVWDFVNWGRQQGIPALARGSGVGTMVGYVMGLSNACPVRYGLLFERFTDPDRSEYPDIDIDLCQDGRAAVIDYVRRKYGHVAQIITFGTLKARAAIRDVGRVLEMTLAEVDRVAKLVPEQLGITIEKALEQEPDLKALYERDATVRRCLDNARALEGQARHASVHAAGVIVATRPLQEIVPLYRPAGSDDIVTQWDGPTCEKMGLLKMDFLGLRTLSVIERCKRLIGEGLPEDAVWAAVGRSADRARLLAEPDAALEIPHPLDLDRLDFADQSVFDVFRRGDTTGVFQFESPGMRRLLMEMKPDRLEDLIAANALFRPGPMDLIPDYNRRKHGQDRVPQVHPIVDRHTAETYGVMVYQEQVMQIVHGLGGIKLRDAYSLIKNISKKKHDKIEKERPKFVEGAQKQGLTKAGAEELFELILKFAGYGFNKSHSTGYAIVAYQTAYLKTYFPNQYMAAFLTFESGASQVADWVPYLEDCRNVRFIDPGTGAAVRTGVEVRPPDINLSTHDFAVVFEPGEPRTSHHGHVRFGLGGIKGVGDKAIESIIKERDGAPAAPASVPPLGAASVAAPAGPALPSASSAAPAQPKPFRSLHEFCERVPIGGAGGGGGGGSGGVGGAVNKATIEALIYSGAMDCLHGRAARAAMIASLESAVAAGSTVQADKVSGQGSLFGFGEPEPAAAPAAASAGAPGEAVTQLARTEPWSEATTLANEKEALGFYLSSHPLDQHKAKIARVANATTRRIRERHFPQDMRVTLAVLVQSVRTIVVKAGKSAGQKMAVVSLEDKEGVIEAVAFTDIYARHQADIAPDRTLFVVGKVDLNRGEPQLVIERLASLESGEMLLARKLRLVLEERRLNGHAEAALERIVGLLRASPPPPAGAGPASGANGALGVEVVVATDAADVFLDASRFRIVPHAEMVQALQRVLGADNVQFVGGAPELAKQEPKRWERKGA